MDKKKKAYFLKIFRLLEKKYSKSEKRLASEGWPFDYQTLITTIMSAQSRDETTIPLAEKLFKAYPSLKDLSQADYDDVCSLLSSLNYYKTKSRNIILTSKMIHDVHNGIIPNSLEELIKFPGVGRKTANLYLSEIHKHDTITVDTHVHRISNVIGLVKTKTPSQTELSLQKIAPKKYWSRINRLFVLWGKDVPSRDKNRLISHLKNANS